MTSKTSFQDWEKITLNKTTYGTAESIKKTSKQQPTITNKERTIVDATEAARIQLIPRPIVMQLIKGRTAKKITQKQLATQLNLNVSVIQQVEGNRHKNDMKLAQTIATALGIRLEK